MKIDVLQDVNGLLQIYVYIVLNLVLNTAGPVNLSTRGAFLDTIPDHAYVGRRVQLVFSVSDQNTVKPYSSLGSCCSFIK